jgi:hypothetical protein
MIEIKYDWQMVVEIKRPAIRLISSRAMAVASSFGIEHSHQQLSAPVLLSWLPRI